LWCAWVGKEEVKKVFCVWRREVVVCEGERSWEWLGKRRRVRGLIWYDGRGEKRAVKFRSNMMKWWGGEGWYGRLAAATLYCGLTKTRHLINAIHSHTHTHSHSLTHSSWLKNSEYVTQRVAAATYAYCYVCPPSIASKLQFHGPTTHYLKTLFLRMPCIN